MRKIVIGVVFAVAAVALAGTSAFAAPNPMPNTSCEGAAHAARASINGNFGWLGQYGGAAGYHGVTGQEAGATGYNNSHVSC